MAEFLPLCDVLFNVISLAGYFCDVVFDVVMSYALLERGYKATFAAAMSIIITSLVITQILSWRWYCGAWCGGRAGRAGRAVVLPAALHCLQLGVLWRYARLFVPLHHAHVKHQVRDLCMLRLVHAFAEAAPMLLLQLHVLLTVPEPEPLPDAEPARDEPPANKAFAELNVISASLSLFSVCWALASFSKNVRLQNVHRLVLTWLGVIFQFLWRLGTISARMCALTAYALAYEYWVFLVIGLHWVSMFLWLISPKNVFHGERISAPRKAYLSALIAFVYVFAYVNLQELNHRQKMVTFYCVMCVENCLLVGAWAAAGRGGAGVGGAAPIFTLAAQAAGLLFMRAYYRYFHVRRLGYMLRENQQGTNSTNASSQNKNGKQLGQGDNAAIPGVFNCRFTNPVGSAANHRKKKKPTTFVPPPAAPAPAPAPNAFWRRPLPAAQTTHNHHGGSSENEGSSVGSRVNIQQKLHEKKQKQLAELRVIEEEIKQGKLAKTTPVAVEEIYSSLQRQPIPRAKTHADPPAWPSLEHTHSYQNYPVLPHTCNLYPTYTEIKTYDFHTPLETTNAENQFKIHRLPPRSLYGQENQRTFYENPNVRSEVTRAPLRTNYLVIGENRSYETGCGSPRNVLNSSPKAYQADLTPGSPYERPTTTPLDKPRIPFDGQPLGEYSSYCDGLTNNQNVYSKEDYANNTLTNETVRSYTEPSNPSLGDRVLYPGVHAGGHGKSKQSQSQSRKMQRCRTPEILLAPHYLEGCGRPVCCHWAAPATYNMSRKKEDGGGIGSSGEESSPEGAARDTTRPPSDIESQISLPRSYTLPREFRYWRRRPRLRDTRLPSNNSSDGDVDSCDNDSDRRSNASASSQLQTVAYADGFAYQQRVGEPARGHEERRPAPEQQQQQQQQPACDRRRRALRKQLAKPETKL